MAERRERSRVPGTAAPSLVRAVRSRRFGIGSCAAALIGIALLGTLPCRPRPLLLWNSSPSSTVGLYWVSPPQNPKVGDTVVAWPPRGAARLAAARRYLPAGVPLVKRVVAAAGDRVCARGRTMLVNGRVAAKRRPRDPSGRRLPWWSGCRRLARGDVMLLGNGGPRAFDGRYFGVTRARQVIGAARLLWPR
jgi:conjugative transfer signal peptidase TraF